MIESLTSVLGGAIRRKRRRRQTASASGQLFVNDRPWPLSTSTKKKKEADLLASTLGTSQSRRFRCTKEKQNKKKEPGKRKMEGLDYGLMDPFDFGLQLKTKEDQKKRTRNVEKKTSCC